jgi:hypothetical protein
MISEEGYWDAKKRIVALENDYATKAMKSRSEHDQRKFWGYSDGMKECLRILEIYAEQKSEKSEK